MSLSVALMRHGETLWNTLGRWQGSAPIPLAENGKIQATEAAPYLVKANFTHIISSDLLRTRQTAAIVNEKLHLKINIDDRWREIDLGRWQGLTMPEIRKWDTEEHSIFESSDYVDRYFPEGESNREHIQRIREALEDIPAQYTDAHVLVVTHGGSIRSAVYHLTGKAIHLTGNCSLTRMRYNGGGWDVLGIAEQPEDVQW